MNLFYGLYFFAENFYLYFVLSIHPYFMEHGFNGYFKGCDNFNIWSILSLRVVEIFLILCMSGNFGLYPGHCKYYVMNLWFLLNSSREFFCFSRVSVGYGSNVCLVSKASVVLIWSLHMYTTQQPDWDRGGGLHYSSVLKAFAVCLWFNYTHMQFQGEPRSWSTDLKDPFF